MRPARGLSRGIPWRSWPSWRPWRGHRASRSCDSRCSARLRGCLTGFRPRFLPGALVPGATASACVGAILSIWSRRVIRRSWSRWGPTPQRVRVPTRPRASFLLSPSSRPTAWLEKKCTFAKSRTSRKRPGAAAAAAPAASAGPAAGSLVDQAVEVDADALQVPRAGERVGLELDDGLPGHVADGEPGAGVGGVGTVDRARRLAHGAHLGPVPPASPADGWRPCRSTPWQPPSRRGRRA